MSLRKFVSLLLTILGALSLLIAAVCLGLGLYESATWSYQVFVDSI